MSLKSIFPKIAGLCLALFLIASKGGSQSLSSIQKLQNFVLQNQNRLGISASELGSLAINHEYIDVSTGTQHIYAVQKIQGLEVLHSNFSLHTSPQKSIENNQLISTKDYIIKPLNINLTSSQSVLKVMDDVKYGADKTLKVKTPSQGAEQKTVFKRNESPIWDITSRLVYYNNERIKALLPAWEVQMMDLYKQHYWLAYIDASNGQILEKRDIMLHCAFEGGLTDEPSSVSNITFSNTSKNTPKNFVEKRVGANAAYDYFSVAPNKYKVFDLPLESPGDTVNGQSGAQTFGFKSGDELGSPDGWHRTANATLYPYTRGNNAWAFYDPSPGPLGGAPDDSPARTAYNNGGPLGTPTVIEPFVFDYPVNLADDPSVYQKGAIVNLFYWNNIIHDVFYRLGFTEAAGNFQASPVFSTGTRAGGVPADDAVLAQAQDGGGVNNANFLTTPDGTPGQMQMYLWTAALPDSLVQITSSTTGIPPSGTKYIAIQGSFNALPTDTANTNLFTRPVVNKQMVVVKRNPMSLVGSETEGCSTGQQSVAFPPGNDVTDKIVLIDRGSCSFIEKVLGAQEGGAAGVIVINNTDGPPQAMGGADATGNAVKIPAVMVSKQDGTFLKNQILSGATVIGSLKRNGPPPPKRDGDLDNGVIAHEYGHGISTRLTSANTTGPLGGGEQGGEGWSDFIALYMTLRTNDLTTTAAHPNGELPTRSIGNYVTYQSASGRGIRPTPYSINMSVNPSTFKDIGKGAEITVPHGVGYIWCTMLYEMEQAFIDKYGMGDNVYEGAAAVGGNPPTSAKGNNIAMRLILEGIKLQGTSPTFVRQRDAILKADTLLFGAQHSCMIWKAFAKRGLGASALSNTNAVGDEFEAFDMPLSCDPNQKRVNIVKSGPVKLSNGTAASYTIRVTNKYATPVTGLIVTDVLPTGLSFTSASDGGTFNPSTGAVTWTFDLAGNASKTLTLVTSVSAIATSTIVFDDDHEISANKWIVENEGGLTNWTYTTNSAEAFSGSKYWFAPNTGTPPGTNTNLRTRDRITVPANGELAFIHKFATEARYDGGVVETSTDGITWTYVPPTKFVRGGYNGIITTTNNPKIGAANLAAFTGSSPGYIVSIAKLDNLVGQSIFIRFRFTCDQTGGTVAGNGWFMDDVYVLSNRSEIANTATATTIPGETVRETEGTNASSTSSAFILSSAPLPTSLGNLSASITKQTSVDLSWMIFSETGGEVYDIERMTTGENTFVKIGSVSSTGSTSASKQYKFQDVSAIPGNRYQYRIKQVALNGKVTYTNIALISLGLKEFAATLYPNPATDVANISISNPLAGKVTITLFDVLGKRIAAFNGTSNQSQLLPIPVRNLNNGTYWVEINTANDEHATLRLVINK